MSKLLRFLIFVFACVSAWFLELNGAFKDGKELTSFEIFQMAFTPAKFSEIADVSIGWPLPEHLKSGLESYLKMVPLDDAACTALWGSWRQGFEEWTKQEGEPLADVYGGVTADWSCFRWAYFDFMKMLLECYPSDALELDINVTQARFCERWPKRRSHVLGLRSEVALFMAVGFLHICMLSFFVHILNIYNDSNLVQF